MQPPHSIPRFGAAGTAGPCLDASQPRQPQRGYSATLDTDGGLRDEKGAEESRSGGGLWQKAYTQSKFQGRITPATPVSKGAVRPAQEPGGLVCHRAEQLLIYS